jgi:excisionase family DNA binding protein
VLEKTDANKEEKQNDDRLLWTINETATKLSVHPKTVSRLIEKGEIPFVKIGRGIRIEKQVVYHFIEANSQYNSGCVESAVRNPTGDRLCRIKTPKDVKMEVPTKVRTTRSASQQMVKDYNALLGRKP